MHKKTATALLLISLLGTLSSCGGGQTQPPGKIAAQTIAFELRDHLTTPIWTYGPGTLTLRRTELSNTTGPVVAQGPIDNVGRGNIQLPGEDQGVLTQADQATSAALIYLFPQLFSQCLLNITESNMNARALYVSQADFATQNGGKVLRFFHIENVNNKPAAVLELLTFVTADNTLSGNVICGSETPLPVNLNFKKGWNSMTLSDLENLTLAVKPVSNLSLTGKEELQPAVPVSLPSE